MCDLSCLFALLEVFSQKSCCLLCWFFECFHFDDWDMVCFVTWSVGTKEWIVLKQLFLRLDVDKRADRLLSPTDCKSSLKFFQKKVDANSCSIEFITKSRTQKFLYQNYIFIITKQLLASEVMFKAVLPIRRLYHGLLPGKFQQSCNFLIRPHILSTLANTLSNRALAGCEFKTPVGLRLKQ